MYIVLRNQTGMVIYYLYLTENMNEIVSNAVKEINKSFESIATYNRARNDKRVYTNEVHQLRQAILDLLEKYPLTRDAKESDGMAEALLISLKLHAHTLDILYDVITEITNLERKAGIKPPDGFER
jgi:hypothetical protein